MMAHDQVNISTHGTAQQGKGMLNNASITGLIRSGYGVLIACILVLIIGAYGAVNFLGGIIANYAEKTAQTVVVVDLAEDMFEARVASLTYRLEGKQDLIGEVIGNIDEILSDPRIDGTLDTTEARRRAKEAVREGMREYLEAFEEIVDTSDTIAEATDRFDALGEEARVALSTIRSDAYQSGDVQPAYHAGVVQENFMLGRFYAARFAAGGNPEDMARSSQYLVDALDRSKTLKSTLTNFMLTQEVTTLQDTVTAMKDILPGLEEAIQTRQQLTEDILEGQGIALQDTVETVLDELLSGQRDLGEKSIQLADRTTILMVAAGLVLAGLATVIAFFVAKLVTSRVLSLADTTDALVEGNLDIDIPGQSRQDESGRLARALVLFRDNSREAREQKARDEQAQREREAVVSALSTGLSRMSAGELDVRMDETLGEDFESLRHDFNTAAERLSEAFAGIVDQTESIEDGASNLSSAADELARRTEGQAAALEETAATIVQISDSVSETATGADKANDFVGTTRSEAESSLTVVASTVDAIKKIQATSAEVSQIIGVIDDIAFQTNLLALNAGVEAARAGDAGQGFAVVASEVRALAQRASNAAKEIKDLIETSVTQVDEGVVKADQTGEALGKIVGMVGEISDLVATISSETRNQSDGLKEINAAVSQLDTVTQQNAAMVEETTAASHDLTRNAQELKRITGGFKTGNQPGFAPISEAALDNEWPMAVAEGF